MPNDVIVRTQFNEAGYHELVNSPTGDLNRYLKQRAERLTFLAKRQVGKHTRELEASIGYQVVSGTSFPHILLYATSSHARMHHEGTSPHIIVPRHGRYLRFRAGGKIVYAKVVKHPGTRPNRFFTDHLREVFST